VWEGEDGRLEGRESRHGFPSARNPSRAPSHAPAPTQQLVDDVSEMSGRTAALRPRRSGSSLCRTSRAMSATERCAPLGSRSPWRPPVRLPRADIRISSSAESTTGLPPILRAQTETGRLFVIFFFAPLDLVASLRAVFPGSSFSPLRRRLGSSTYAVCCGLGDRLADRRIPCGGK